MAPAGSSGNSAGEWNDRPKDDVKNVLSKHGKDDGEIKAILGEAILNPWKLVIQPFQPEYLGDRQWNRNAAQLKYQPAEGDHPHWDMILRHSFNDLDEDIKEHPWCQKHSVKTGAEYGLLWAANLFRSPFKHLPYLFFYGDENCGKSTFHESFVHLMTKGYISADQALQSQGNFNGELEGMILAYTEEVDLTKDPRALDRIKDWVTSPRLCIRKMRANAYSVPNTLHFCQSANFPERCPIFPGDTRITMIYVPPLGEREIEHDTFHSYLAKEAPAFLYTLLNVTLPAPPGRLCVPVIETDNKRRMQDMRASEVDQFIKVACKDNPGRKSSLRISLTAS